MTHTLTFSTGKVCFAEFQAEAVQAERGDNGMLLSAHGEMVRQDDAVLENFMHGGAACHVRLESNGQTVLDGQFSTLFFILEADQITVQLA